MLVFNGVQHGKVGDAGRGQLQNASVRPGSIHSRNGRVIQLPRHSALTGEQCHRSCLELPDAKAGMMPERELEDSAVDSDDSDFEFDR